MALSARAVLGSPWAVFDDPWVSGKLVRSCEPIPKPTDLHDAGLVRALARKEHQQLWHFSKPCLLSPEGAEAAQEVAAAAHGVAGAVQLPQYLHASPRSP